LEAERRRHERERQEREARLRAVAAAVAPLCRPHAAALLVAIREDGWLFARLLEEALAEAEDRA